LLEETYEVLDAIDSDDPSALRDELGDLLFQILLMARMADEADEFTLEDVTQAVNDKMIRRHPHVFDPHHQATGTEGSIETWEARKAKERSSDTSVLDGVPTALPSLLRAYRITEKASRVGFDWPDFSGVRAKLDEEIGELDEACADGHPEAIGHEYGDLLLTVVNMGRFLPVTPEEALRGAVKRFEHRFRAVETALVI